MAGVVWVRRTQRPLYEHCKVIKARYNCSRFNTSASDYFLGWGSAGEQCRLPSHEEVYLRLTSKTNILIIGDSHSRQLFESLLCAYSDKAQDIVVFDDAALHMFHTYDEMPECHGIARKDYPTFFLDRPERTPDFCGAAEKNTYGCFTLRDSRICNAYVRPLTGKTAVDAGLFEFGRGLNLTVQNFDVVITNDYIDASALGRALAAVAYSGSVVTVPKFTFGAQTGFRETADTLQPSTRHNSNAIVRFCNQLLSSSRKETVRFSCDLVDFRALSVRREGDAKASIFPTWQRKDDGTQLVCEATQNLVGKPSPCVRFGAGAKPTFVCDSVPCASESHFCLPGPPDDFSLVALSAAVNAHDKSKKRKLVF